MGRIAVLLVLAVGLAVVIVSPFAESRSVGGVKVVERLGPDVSLAPGQTGQAVANCPKGYVAVSGMEFMGAIDVVFSSSTTSRRGWTVGGGNPSSTDPFTFSAGVICEKGSGRVKVRKATVANAQRALRDWRASQRR